MCIIDAGYDVHRAHTLGRYMIPGVHVQSDRRKAFQLADARAGLRALLFCAADAGAFCRWPAFFFWCFQVCGCPQDVGGGVA